MHELKIVVFGDFIGSKQEVQLALRFLRVTFFASLCLLELMKGLPKCPTHPAMMLQLSGASVESNPEHGH